MKRFRGLLKQTEFHILLFVFGFLPLSWPIMGILENKHPLAVPVYLFAVWAVLIFLLCLMSRSIGGDAAGSEEKEEKGDRC